MSISLAGEWCYPPPKVPVPRPGGPTLGVPEENKVARAGLEPATYGL